MVLQITAGQQGALVADYQRALARRITVAARSTDLPRYEGYMREALGLGLTVEADVAELAIILGEMDAAGGRPRLVREVMQDPEIGPDLKLMQVSHMWRGGYL